MNVARITFGILYLGGALANITLTVLNGPESYHSFADGTLLSFYREAWATLVVPIMTLFIALLIAFEITLGMLFITKRRFMKIALVLSIIFCLGTAPFGLEAVYINIPLGLIQVFLLWKELHMRTIAP